MNQSNHNKKFIKGNKKARIIRWSVLLLSTVFFVFSSRIISNHAVCPIGGFELFFTGLFTTGFSIAGLLSGMVITFLIMSVFSIIFRRAYCGYICPYGALQEFFRAFGKRILPKKTVNFRMPDKADRVLRLIKYIVLAFFVIGAAVWSGHWMIKGDPFIVLTGLLGRRGGLALIKYNPIGFIFFIAILLSSIFLGRGFCKYICPAGAWYAIMSKIGSLFNRQTVIRNSENCINCGLCSKNCSMGIDVAHLEKVKTVECIGCRECVNICPQKNALSAPVTGLDIRSSVIPLSAAVVFSGSVLLASSIQPKRGDTRGGNPNGGNRSGQIENDNSPRENTGKDVSLDQKDISPGDKVVFQKNGIGGCSFCNGCGLL